MSSADIERIENNSSLNVIQSPPTKVLRAIINCYGKERKQLITEHDANAHQPICRRTNNNLRGGRLTQHLLSLNINIHNLGNKLTFATCNEEEVINLH
jgi:hypothetical protein